MRPTGRYGARVTASSNGSSGTQPAIRRPHPVILVGLVLVALQVTVRAWASAGSWFIGDDFNLMTRLYDVPLTLAELFTPHDSQLMPGGILSAWVMANSGPQNWTVGAAIVVAFQALASAACLLMLVTVFGRRWAIIPLLLVYLASPLTITAYMWWAAAINQVPLQAAFFLTLSSAVLYFRTRRWRWLWLTLAGVALGMAFYVKAALMLPVVAGVALLFFGPKTPSVEAPVAVPRGKAICVGVRETLRAYAPMWAALVVVGAAYTTLYVRTVDNPLEAYELDWAATADNFFRVSLGPAVIGGPWRWWNPIAPGGLVDPPPWAVTATWIGIAFTAYWLHQRGGAQWRALVILGGYLVAIYFLVAVGRASVVGSIAALELRYLADATPVIVLTLGLLVLEVRRPVDSAHVVALPRERDARRAFLGKTAVCLVLLVGAGVSTARYVALWHADYVGKAYTRNVAAAAQVRDLHVVDQWVPEAVVSPLRVPDNYVSRVFRPLAGVHAHTAGTDLQIIDDLGYPRRAEVVAGLRSAPGPVPGCGYPVKGVARTIELSGPDDAAPPESEWWIAIEYLASQDGTATATLAAREVEVPVMQGLHQYLARGEGPIDEVTLDPGRSGLGLCVDKVTVGKVQAWDK
jgi:hypothetical protein